MIGTLYLVATPIGNLDDLSPRAARVLASVDIVACEDTRVTRRLLRESGRAPRFVSIHEHSSDTAIDGLIAALKDGKNAAFASDAGTPGVSDPGGKLVAAAVQAEITVVPIPGPSAVTALLSVAGLRLTAYSFYGYPPHKKGRQKFLDEILAEPHPVVLYESKYRIAKLLSELVAKGAGDRYCIVGNDLTKKFEQILRGEVKELINYDIIKKPLGEYVLLLTPPGHSPYQGRSAEL